MINFLKTKDKENILKAAREKWHKLPRGEKPGGYYPNCQLQDPTASAAIHASKVDAQYPTQPRWG